MYQKLAIDLDDLKLEELLALIEQYPNLLKRPIIVDGDKLQVGYNEDDIRKFVPRNIRKVIFKSVRKICCCSTIIKNSSGESVVNII